MARIRLPNDAYPEYNAALAQVQQNIARVYQPWVEHMRSIPMYVDTDLRASGPHAEGVTSVDARPDCIVLPPDLMVRTEGGMGGITHQVQRMTRENVAVAIAHEYGHFFAASIPMQRLPVNSEFGHNHDKIAEARSDFFAAQIMGATALVREMQFALLDPTLSMDNYLDRQTGRATDHPTLEQRMTMAVALVRDPGLLRHAIGTLEITPDARIIDHQHPTAGPSGHPDGLRNRER